MKICVYPLPELLPEKQLNDKNIIIVDVLRATTSILQALVAGANQVVPAKSLEDGRALASNWDRRDVIMAGEKNCLDIPGYDTGNSPITFTEQLIMGKNVVICTTNGTNAIIRARNARQLLLGCLRNKTAVARAAYQGAGQDGEIIIICAGSGGEISEDDVICAGGILQAINCLNIKDVEYNDFALMSVMMYNMFKNGLTDLSETAHYQKLISLGFKDDIVFCFEEDTTDIVPIYIYGALKPFKY